VTSFDAPDDVTWHEVVLEPDDRTVKSPTQGTAEPLPGRIALGEPVAVPLTPERAGDDTELRSFIEEHAGVQDFALVHLACTFRHVDDEPFERASLQVRLRRADGGDPPSPIAWSMSPLRETTTTEVTDKVTLGAKVKFVDVGAERSATVARADLFVEALNEQRADPGWEFSRTNAAQLRGVQRLALVTMAPAGSGVAGTIEVTATVRRHRFGPFTYKATLSEVPALTFSLPAPTPKPTPDGSTDGYR
jgi:hypothetical protein